jgi:CxxC-x17-CxxC domain-containing protein
VPFADKTLTCIECGQTFLFSADDQEFFASRGYLEPKRCRNCRANRRVDRDAGQARPEGIGAPAASRPPRQLYDAVCANCGRPTQVPFQPRGTRPVYCRECFQTMGAPAGGPRY